MKNQSEIQELLNEVQQAEGESFVAQTDNLIAEYLAKNAEKATLAIKVLSIFGGFLGTSTFIAFLMLAGLYNSEIGMLILGIVLLVGSVVVNRTYNKLILDTSSIASYIAGLFLLAFGLGSMEVSENVVAIICIFIALTTMFITQAYMLTFVSVLVINAAFLFLIADTEIYALINCYVALLTGLLTLFITQEANLITFSARLNKLYEPTKIALILVLLLSVGTISKKGLFNNEIELLWLPSVVSIGCILYVVSLIIKRLDINSVAYRLLILVGSVLILLPTVLAPAIACAMLVLLLCFLANYKTGFAISIIAFLYFIGQYYYDLSLTLLTKSIILMVSGVLFLVFYYLITITYQKKS